MNARYPSLIIQEVERSWNWRFACISIKIDLGFDTRDILFNDAELTQPTISAAQIVKSEDFFQRRNQRWSNQSRTETVVHAMPKESVRRQGPMRINLLRIRKGCRVHSGRRCGDENGLIGFDMKGATRTVLECDVFGCYTR